MENIFTVADGIKVQTRQLEDWKKLLKKSVYLDLVEETEKQNLNVKSGHEVFRGSGISNFIDNYLLNKKKIEYRVYVEGFKTFFTNSQQDFENKQKSLNKIGIPYHTELIRK